MNFEQVIPAPAATRADRATPRPAPPARELRHGSRSLDRGRHPHASSSHANLRVQRASQDSSSSIRDRPQQVIRPRRFRKSHSHRTVSTSYFNMLTRHETSFFPSKFLTPCEHMFIIRHIQKCAKTTSFSAFLKNSLMPSVMISLQGRALNVNQKCTPDGFKMEQKSVKNRF